MKWLENFKTVLAVVAATIAVAGELLKALEGALPAGLGRERLKIARIAFDRALLATAEGWSDAPRLAAQAWAVVQPVINAMVTVFEAIGVFPKSGVEPADPILDVDTDPDDGVTTSRSG